MSGKSRLFAYKNLYDIEGSDDLFMGAVRENIGFHRAHCPEYGQLLKRGDFQEENLHTTSDLSKIPPIPTLYLKSHQLFSIPYDKLLIKASSSGTKGTPSRMGMDIGTAWHALRMVWRTFTHHQLLSPRPTNYIVLGYRPHKSNQMGAVKTAYATTLAAPALHREYALEREGDSYRLNMDGILSALERYEKAGHPVRFMGFPAYFYFLLEELEERGIRMKLHPKSKVFLAGGWKQFFAQQQDKHVLYEKAGEVLGIGEENCRDFFGAVEHPIVYCDCPNHRFHVPVYSRIIIRDVRTLGPVPPGTPGLLNLITPLMGSMPFVSVMTDDVAVLHPADSCGCGTPSPWFEILGRAGLEDLKTCAATAGDLLGGLKG